VNYLLAIKSLYVINGFIAVLMYIPQIVAIWKNRNDSASVSPITFGGWSLGCVITILYAWFFVGDKIFTAVSAGNLIGSGTVFLLVAKKKFHSKIKESILP
jgi:uncharacterized protein with PQ loop repeat